MCVAALAWNAHRDWQLVAIGNRDEYHERPAAPLALWQNGIIAGRDLQLGGTWLGVSGERFALVTNLRGHGLPDPAKVSRGSLVTDLLRGSVTELGSKGVQAKFASYVDDLGAMLAGTAQYKMFTLDGGGGTSIFGQAQPFFWGTRAITPNDPMPGLFQYLKETNPDAKTVGMIGWDIGEPANGIIKEDVLKKIADAGLEFNDLYELVPVGGQDFSQVLPKIKSNEPDILLVSNYGQDPGSFANQASTAGLKSIRVGFEFTPDGISASKGTYDSDGYTFAYDYFDSANPVSPLAQLFVTEFEKEHGELPDFYAANFYENAFVMWELMRRVLAEGGEITGETLDAALRSNLTVVSVYGGDASTVGTFTLDETSHSVLKRDMGVFEYKDGTVTPKAFFGIDGVDFKLA